MPLGALGCRRHGFVSPWRVVIGLKRSILLEQNRSPLGFGFSFLALWSAALIVFAISPQHTAIRGGLELGWLRLEGKYSYGAFTCCMYPYKRLSCCCLGPIASKLGRSLWGTRLRSLLVSWDFYKLWQ